ncbi:MAG: hypothetical protein RLZZ282_375 [Verrucomicrobiota bacterium]
MWCHTIRPAKILGAAAILGDLENFFHSLSVFAQLLRM